MGANPSHFKGNTRPVDSVSWDDAGAFTTKLKGLTGKPIRLPSEAEWEYACRARTTTDYHTGDGEAALKTAGWYSGNSGGQTHSVGERAANGWRLCDMHANVWEWCQDEYGPYVGSDQTDPQGQTNEHYRVLRGGGWNGTPDECRAASRYCMVRGFSLNYYGCRVCFRLD